MLGVELDQIFQTTTQRFIAAQSFEGEFSPRVEQADDHCFAIGLARAADAKFDGCAVRDQRKPALLRMHMFGGIQTGFLLGPGDKTPRRRRFQRYWRLQIAVHAPAEMAWLAIGQQADMQVRSVQLDRFEQNGRKLGGKIISRSAGKNRAGNVFQVHQHLRPIHRLFENRQAIERG
ncbi:MAG: hypothetical protein ACD_10C00055G0001 [uncultured bacterium]|nr:MAG: hypothetical protein ACD_10C00055G0001 [uncultured bacterium]